VWDAVSKLESSVVLEVLPVSPVAKNVAVTTVIVDRGPLTVEWNGAPVAKWVEEGAVDEL
jgi:hypothetical protein